MKTITTNTSEEFAAALAEDKASGQTIAGMKRGSGNASWVLSITTTEQPLLKLFARQQEIFPQ